VFPSKEYIAEIQKPEYQWLQDQWEPAMGDFFYVKARNVMDDGWDDEGELMCYGSEDALDRAMTYKEDYPEDLVWWVPRSGQLLRMIVSERNDVWGLHYDIGGAGISPEWFTTREPESVEDFVPIETCSKDLEITLIEFLLASKEQKN